MKDIEKYLNSSLRPVQPAPEFVNQLRGRLASGPAITLEEHPRQYGYLMIIFGLISGLFLLWLLRRLNV